jgi:hypothetical protein
MIPSSRLMGNEMARDGTRLALFIDGANEPRSHTRENGRWRPFFLAHPKSHWATFPIGQHRWLIRMIAGLGFGGRRSLARHNGNAPCFTEARASRGMARQATLGDRARKLTATQRNDNRPSG